MMKIIHTLFFLISFCSMYAQTPVIDSLRKELSKDKLDSIKVHDRIRICWYLIKRGDSTAWKYLHESDSIANKTGNRVLQGLVLESKGFLHEVTLSKKAIGFYLEALNYLKDYPNSPAALKSMITLKLSIGYQLMQMNNYEDALTFMFDAMQRAEAMDVNHKDLPVILNNIANCYMNLKKYEQALQYSEKAYTKSKSYGPTIARMLGAANYGQTLYKLNRKAEAQKYLDETKAIGEAASDDYMLGKYYEIIGTLKIEDSAYTPAYQAFQTASPYVLRSSSEYGICELYFWLGITSYKVGKINDAKRFQDSAFAIAKANQFNYFIRDIYNQKFEMERHVGNPAKAFEYLDSVTFWRDSLEQKENLEKIEFMDARYQAQKKEVQIGQLTNEKELQALTIKQKNTLNYILVGGSIALLLIGALLYKNYRSKQQLQQQRINELETEKQLTATEAVMKGEEQERSRLAKDLHDGLGGMLSGIKYSLDNMKGNLIMTPDNAQALERSIDMLDSSIKEMRRVAHNLMPEALVKFGLDAALKDFCTDINQSGALKINYQSLGMDGAVMEQTTAITIFRIVQELVNNIIKHASAKEAIVQLSKTNEAVSITVEDDGHGFDIAALQRSKGMGWSNIQNRVEFLKGKLDVQSAPGKGTSVLIELAS